MKTIDTPFLSNNPLFYRPLPFYGKNLISGGREGVATMLLDLKQKPRL